jgi:hypothetical protein
VPRVFRKTKNRGGHHVYQCEAQPCLAEGLGGTRDIIAGQDYLTWKFNRGGRHFRHAACGHPRRSELTNSKMGAVYDAVDDFDPTTCETLEDLQAALQDVATAANDVAAEYGEAADGIESSWPSGNPTSEACRATADELESWANNLESWEPTADESDDDYLDAIREEAQELVNESPEYQG